MGGRPAQCCARHGKSASFNAARFWKDIGCAALINEGGIGVKDALFEGQDIHAISVAEKGLFSAY